MWFFFLLLSSGYTGNRFFTYAQFGHTSKVDTQSALCDFTNGYQFTKNSEWSPLPFYHASLDGEKPGNEIYPRSTGMIPSYKGHVPGMLHRYVHDVIVNFNLMSNGISINFIFQLRKNIRTWKCKCKTLSERFVHLLALENLTVNFFFLPKIENFHIKRQFHNHFIAVLFDWR